MRGGKTEDRKPYFQGTGEKKMQQGFTFCDRKSTLKKTTETSSKGYGKGKDHRPFAQRVDISVNMYQVNHDTVYLIICTF